VCKEHYKRQRSTDKASESQIATQSKRHTSTVREEDVIAEEAQNSAEGRVPDGATTTGVGAAWWHVRAVMKSARKLVLVDENDREYKRLQRRPEDVSKTGKSLQLSDTLRDRSIADDRKVREYVSNLYRYLNTRREVPVEPKVELNTERPPPPPPPTRRRQKQKQHAWVRY